MSEFETATEDLQVIQLQCGQDIAPVREAAASQNCVYMVVDQSTGNAAVFDAAWDIDSVFDIADQLDVEITMAIYTHSHQDHTGGGLLEGAKEMAEQEVPVYVAAPDCAAVIKQCDVPGAIGVEDGEVLSLGGAIGIRCIHTPGHTPGSACFALGGDGSEDAPIEVLITGDTLFVQAFGRVDLPNSNPDAMFDSLSYLKELDDDAIVLPGHSYSGNVSTIGRERSSNLAFRCESAQQFRILAGVAEKPGQSKYDMGDSPGARTSRRGGGGGGSGGVSGSGAAGSSLPSLFREPEEEGGSALLVCSCATQITPENLLAAGISPLWCAVAKGDAPASL